MHLADPMVQSFNYAVGRGLQAAIDSVTPVEFDSNDNRIVISLRDVRIDTPNVPANTGGILDRRVFPRQCIESASTYKGSATATIAWSVNNKFLPMVEQSIGNFPIMVKSNLCNLHGMKPTELVNHGEDVNDPGGYFIVNGSKKVLRLLTSQRRNYPIAIIRDTWRQKQKDFSDKGLILLSVAKDETTTTNILHYLNTGCAKLQFYVNKRPFIIDLIILLKAFKDINDRELVKIFSSMRDKDTFFIEKIKQMLTDLANAKLFTSDQCRNYIGKSFRLVLKDLVPPHFTDVDVCKLVLDKYVFVHLNDGESKFNFMCFMACKLYSFVAGDIVAESLDVTSMMEAQLSGFLYLKYLKEKLQDIIFNLKWLTWIKLKGESIDYVITDADTRKICSQARKVGIDLQSLVSTGNISSKSGIGMTQVTGLSIILEGLNRMRDLSHLRAIHRGSYFLEMKTVLPRRLTGEAWGFICPVHTPDGAPCGLLNHLAFNCAIPAHPPAKPASIEVNIVLKSLGMVLVSTQIVLAGNYAILFNTYLKIVFLVLS